MKKLEIPDSEASVYMCVGSVYFKGLFPLETWCGKCTNFGPVSLWLVLSSLRSPVSRNTLEDQGWMRWWSKHLFSPSPSNTVWFYILTLVWHSDFLFCLICSLCICPWTLLLSLSKPCMPATSFGIYSLAAYQVLCTPRGQYSGELWVTSGT